MLIFILSSIIPIGWSGNDCELNIDECGSNPCLNTGRCIDGINNYTCNCTGTGYEGLRCETDIDECELYAPCLNGGTCNDISGGYSCNCAPGYIGDNCEMELNECLSLPCKNGATCSDLLGDYRCECTAEWMGKDCTEMYDPCIDLEPCQNGANCTSTPPLSDYTCECVPGYDGINCENDIDECAGVTCPEAGQICFDLINGYECRCPDGYDGDGCLNDINECASNPCVNGGICRNEIGKVLKLIQSLSFENACCATMSTSQDIRVWCRQTVCIKLCIILLDLF